MARHLSRVIFSALLISALGLLSGCNKSGSNTPAPNAKAASVELPSTGSLAVEAQLEELPGPFPANDLYNYVFIMKYRVVKVLRGQYADSVILVGHYNPRFARSEIHDDVDSLVDGELTSFRPGDVHRLVLSDLDSIWTKAVEDGYFRDTHKRFFARWVSLAK